MLLRVSLIILIISISFGCSNEGSEKVFDEVSPEPNGLKLAESNPGDISVVCGVIFQVEDFETWVAAYNKVGKNTIHKLRNIIDPSLVIVFEGTESLEMAEGRASVLTDAEFLTRATVMGDPIVFYNDVQYMNPPKNDYKYYVALIFEMQNINQFIESLKTNLVLYAEHGLTPMGIGTNPYEPTQVYMLLTLDDYVSFKKKTNSPRKKNRFAKSLGLPEETLVLNMAKSNL